ncbi:MAG: glycosyltransferase family 2 protein [Bacteroidetes bacterium]|nr:glycosyltransferase family 2 protein [Bacteroidota bacterium]
MSQPKVAVVILNWNGKKFLEKFLCSVMKFSTDVAEVIVADNASTDDSISYLKLYFPTVRIIEMPVNAGYTGGYNQALKQIEADYFILLNSDIEVTPNWISPIIDLMESDKSIAACQPKILDYNNIKKFEYAGAGGGFIDFLGYPFCRGRIFNNLEEDNGQYNDITEVFWATGACMFVRAESFFKAGGFDDDFFAHMEEIDLCWRFKRLGFKIKYCGKSSILHVGGGTLSKNNPRKTYYNFRNNLFLLTKNLPLIQLLFVMTFRPALDKIAAISFLLKGNVKDFIAVHKAWISFLSNACKMRKKDKEIVRVKVGKIYKRSIILCSIVLRKKAFSQLKKESFS